MKDKDLASVIFQVVDCVDHGIPNLIQPSMRAEIAKLNFKAASRAMELSDYDTAQNYFNQALVLLPENHWENDYEFSLGFYFLRSKVAYACGDVENASTLLKEIIDKGSCLQDKLDAYYLYAMLRGCAESICCCHTLYCY